jgi:hypothetical protein
MTKPTPMFSGDALAGCRQEANRLVELLGKLESIDEYTLAECRASASRLKNELDLAKWEAFFPGYPFAK